MTLIEQIAIDEKYINYCKKVTNYNSLWKDLHQEFLIRVIERIESVKQVYERNEHDFYLCVIIYNLWHDPRQGRKKLKTHDVGTSPLYQISDNEKDLKEYFEERKVNQPTNSEIELKKELVKELNVLLESNNKKAREGAKYLRLYIEGKNRLQISKELDVNYRIVHESIDNTINIIKSKMTGKKHATKTEIQITLRGEGVKASYSGKDKTFYVDKLPASGIIKEVEQAGFKVEKSK